MNIKKNTLTFEKELLDENNLTIIIGNGQTGVITLIKPNGKAITKKNIIENEPIGSKDDIKNKKIIISAVITDFRDDTDLCTLQINLNAHQFEMISGDADPDDRLLSFPTVIKL
ncbi:MAG: hypothetical protein JNL24_06985 [Bacteroidia bacterium]|nr:hypothetical protein [Bacteroidia bacterium]